MIVEIKDLGTNGEGVARTPDNKVCFVDFSLPNEVVDVDICKEKNKFCYAKINNILTSSPDRVAPMCQYFGVCGGCDLQHLKYDKQCEFKKNKVISSLRKVSDIKVADTEKSQEFFYRNKMVFVASGFPIRLGMIKKGSHDFVETKKCLLTSDTINNILSLSSDYFGNSEWSGYNPLTKTGDIKYIVIREFSNDVLVTIVATRKLNLKDYYLKLATASQNVGLSIIISDSDREILSGTYTHLYGIGSLTISEFGIKYKINNLGFLQVNNKLKEKMYLRVLEDIDESDNVIDAYSGAGLLSAIVSQKARNVVGIEINKSASASACELIKENGITNCSFICGDVAKHLGDVAHNFDEMSVVLDPTRSGCDRVVCDTLIANLSKIKKIIYISCNPSTLGRDLELLNKNFAVKTVIPFDLFPNTKHVETYVLLERK